jgi:hypothetical protein
MVKVLRQLTVQQNSGLVLNKRARRSAGSIAALLQDTTCHECSEFALQAWRRAQCLSQFGEIPPFVRLRQCCGKQLPADGGKQ